MNWSLAGYKGIIGGVGLMAMAVGRVLYDLYNGTAPDLNAFATEFLAGLGILGIRVAMS